MGFSKKNYDPVVAISVKHGFHPGDVYTFHFPKVLLQDALDAQSKFIGLAESALADVFRVALIETVAAMSVRDPEGFEDFPTGEPTGAPARPLRERIIEYFDDVEKPELEAIIIKVWTDYRQKSISTSYTKSLSGADAGSGVLPQPIARPSPPV